MWLYCHFPQLLLDNRVRLQPSIDELPLAFYQINNGQSVIVQCNAAAQAQGVQVSQQTVMALSLCHNVQLMEYVPDKEASVLQQVALRLYRWAAKLVLYSPNGLAVELNSLIQLYSGLENVVATVSRGVRELPLTAQLATAETPLAARLLAISGHSGSLHPEEQARVLAQLPVCAAGFSAKTQKQCAAAGFQQLGRLMQLPDAEVGKHLGLDALLHLQKLRGDKKQSYCFFTPSEDFEQRLDLVTEVAHWQGLLFPLKRLLGELEAFLYQRQKATQRIQIKLYHRQAEPSEIPISLAEPDWRSQKWLVLLQLKAESFPLPEPVIEVQVIADTLQPVNSRNASFWEGSAHQHEQLQLVTQLQAKLGEGAVFSPAVNNDPRPGLNEYKVPPGQRVARSPQALRRPLWLLPKAEPVSIADWQLQQGPERKACGWWDGAAVKRDYWIASDPFHRQGWLYFEAGQWHLQGWFS